MYDSLQQAFNQKQTSPVLRHLTTARFQDLSAVEPWQKSTLEILVQDQPVRQFKTFYHSPKKIQQNKNYRTLRGFSLRENRAAEPLTKSKSMAASSRKSSLSQYNINGNILGDVSVKHKSIPIELPLKPFRIMRQKDKLINTKAKQYSQPIFNRFENLMEIQRKIKIQNQKSNRGFIQFNSQLDSQPYHIQSTRRTSKALCLGFYKISMIKRLRQRSNKSKLQGQN